MAEERDSFCMNFLWMFTLSIQYSNEMRQLYKNSVLPIFLSDVYQTQSFSLYKKTICELHSEKCLHSMNYCALLHYLRGHVTNKQLNSMHFCWRSLDDKSLSSLLELRKNVFPMHVYKYCKNYNAESVWLWLWHDLFWYKTLIFYSRWRK